MQLAQPAGGGGRRCDAAIGRWQGLQRYSAVGIRWGGVGEASSSTL